MNPTHAKIFAKLFGSRILRFVSWPLVGIWPADELNFLATTRWTEIGGYDIFPPKVRVDMALIASGLWIAMLASAAALYSFGAPLWMWLLPGACLIGFGTMTVTRYLDEPNV